MKRTVTSALIVLLSSVANAEEPSSNKLHNWNGLYIGVNAGYGAGDRKGSYVDFVDPSENVREKISGDGFVGGAQAGYNWRAGSFVYGIETDAQYSKLAAVTVEDHGGGDWSKITLGVDWFGTTRARVGYLPTENVLLYATGGAAYGRLVLSVKAHDSWVGYQSWKIDKTQFGWAGGLGAEVALTDTLSVKTEYLHTDLGRWTFRDDDGRSEYSFGFHTIRAGFNVAF